MLSAIDNTIKTWFVAVFASIKQGVLVPCLDTVQGLIATSPTKNVQLINLRLDLDPARLLMCLHS